MDNNFKYAMKLALLNQLFNQKLITDKEYIAVKNHIKKKHKINKTHHTK